MLPVLAVQHDIQWEDKPATQAHVESMLAQQAPSPGGLVLLPELFDTGFSLRLEVVADQPTLPWSAAVARRYGSHVAVGHGERGPDGRGRNCTTLLDPSGEVRGRYEKIHPFGCGGEQRAYGAGNRLLLADVGGLRVCPLICYDLRFPELWRLAAVAGAEVFLLGASWPAARQQHWRALCIARAIENQAYVVAVNRVGRDPSLSYAGGSLVVGPRGEVVAEAGAGEECLRALLDPCAVRTWRAEFPTLRDLVRDHLGRVEVVKASTATGAAVAG